MVVTVLHCTLKQCSTPSAVRESSRKSGDLMRSRTRENNVYVEEEQ